LIRSRKKAAGSRGGSSFEEISTFHKSGQLTVYSVQGCAVRRTR
jgi:hypothetical protein